MKTVVAIGELLIDFVPQQKGCALDEVVQFERVAGGAPANVATAVARLGGHSRMVSQVGEDAFGTHILKVLNAANVDTSSVFRTNRANTALAFVSLDKTGNREFSFYRNPSADLFLDETQIAPEMFENCAALHFCSVDLVDWPVRQAHVRAIELAKQVGAFLSFDPNVRLPLWSSPADCQAAIREFLPYADLVKLRGRARGGGKAVRGRREDGRRDARRERLGGLHAKGFRRNRNDCRPGHGHDRRGRLVHRLVPLSADARRRDGGHAFRSAGEQTRGVSALFRALRLADRAAQRRRHADLGGGTRGVPRLTFSPSEGERHFAAKAEHEISRRSCVLDAAGEKRPNPPL